MSPVFRANLAATTAAGLTLAHTADAPVAAGDRVTVCSRYSGRQLPAIVVTVGRHWSLVRLTA